MEVVANLLPGGKIHKGVLPTIEATVRTSRNRVKIAVASLDIISGRR